MANDPWAAYRVKPAQPQQTPPPPPVSGTPALPTATAKVQQQQNQQQAATIAANRDQRDAVELENSNTRTVLAEQANQRAAEEAAAKQKALAANGGVDTNVSQDQALFHAGNLIRNLNSMNEATRTNPNAARPGLVETVVGAFTDNADAKSWAQNYSGGSERQIAAAAADGALESSVYLFTGAAAQNPQVERMKSLIKPAYFDGEATLRWKRGNIEAQIKMARLRAGPADLKLQAALDELEGSLDILYSPDRLKAQGSGFESGEFQNNVPPKVQNYPVAGSGDGRFEQSVTGSWRGPEYRYEPDYAVTDQVDAMLMSGKGPAEIEAYLTSQGLRPGIDYDPITEADMVAAQRRIAYLKTPAGQKSGEKGITKAITRRVEQGPMERLSQGEPGVSAMNWANAFTGGAVRAVSSEQDKRNFDMRNEASPFNAAVSDILGSVGPVEGLTRLAGRGLYKGLGKRVVVEDLEKLARIAGNTVYGAARGAVDAPEGQRVEGALFGGGLAAVGGVAGEGISAGGRGLARTRTGEALRELEGVDQLTPYQRMGLGQKEETFQGIPWVRRARQKAQAGWNIDNANRALANVDETLPKGTKAGTEANAKVDEILNQHYNEIRPQISGTVDAELTSSLAKLKNDIHTTADPTKISLWQQIEGVLAPLRKGTYDGTSYKDIDQTLRNLADDWKRVEGGQIPNPSTYHEMARVSDLVRTKIRAQVSRHNPVLGAKLKKLDKAWAHKSRIEDATNRAGGQSYSPDQLLTTLKMLDTSKNRGRFARGKAFDQKYAEAARTIMGGKKVPENSNLVQTMGLLYLMGRHPITAGAPATAASMAYLPGIKQLVNQLAKSPTAGKLVRGSPSSLRGGPSFNPGLTTALAQLLRQYSRPDKPEER